MIETITEVQPGTVRNHKLRDWLSRLWTKKNWFMLYTMLTKWDKKKRIYKASEMLEVGAVRQIFQIMFSSMFDLLR